LEQEWREWTMEAPRNADAAFVGFCLKVFEKRGSAGLRDRAIEGLPQV
jgi:hypothetical protein